MPSNACAVAAASTSSSADGVVAMTMTRADLPSALTAGIAISRNVSRSLSFVAAVTSMTNAPSLSEYVASAVASTTSAPEPRRIAAAVEPTTPEPTVPTAAGPSSRS